MSTSPLRVGKAFTIICPKVYFTSFDTNFVSMCIVNKVIVMDQSIVRMY